MSQPPLDPLIGAYLAAHQNSDINEDVDSYHHTLGPGPTQAAPGNHTHGDGIIGSLLMFAGIAIPSKYILCDGTAIDRITYADLFATIGTAYGVGNGTTTFNLPNFTNAFPRGNTTGSGGSDSHDHGSVGAGTPVGSISTNNETTDHDHDLSFIASDDINDGHSHGGTTATTSLAQQSNTTATGASLRLTSPDPHSHGISATGTFHHHSFHSGTTTGGKTVAHNHAGTFTGTPLGGHDHGAQNNIPAYTGVKFLIRYAV